MELNRTSKKISRNDCDEGYRRDMMMFLTAMATGADLPVDFCGGAFRLRESAQRRIE